MYKIRAMFACSKHSGVYGLSHPPLTLKNEPCTWGLTRKRWIKICIHLNLSANLSFNCSQFLTLQNIYNNIYNYKIKCLWKADNVAVMALLLQIERNVLCTAFRVVHGLNIVDISSSEPFESNILSWHH